uniref:Ulp1 protease family, C-terminal catalytic domain containing protein n=1 Tax=Solanum tuberosum TaxID=4113 RepID=M1D9Y4_SOLTU
MYAKTKTDRDDMFIVNWNSKDLHFGRKEFRVIRKELKAFEDKVDGQFANMKKFMDASFLKIIEELRSFHKVEKENEDVEEPKSQLVALEAKATHVTPIEQVRKKAPGKYAQSPYTDLIDSGGTSQNRPVYFLMKYPFVNCNDFDVDMNLIKASREWYNDKVSKKRGRKPSVFTIAKNVIKTSF